MENLQVHGAYILGSPPPTIPCHYCPRHFKSSGGRTRHILAKHFGMPEPHAPDPATDPLHISSSPQPSFHGANPVPSDFASPPPSDSESESDRSHISFGVPEPHAPNPATDPSRISSSPQSSFHGPNPVRSDFPSPPFRSSDSGDDTTFAEPNAYLDIDDHQFDQGSPGGNPDVGRRHVPDAPRSSIIRTYHPNLNGVSNFFFDIIRY
jgi:hypothetical protein